MKQLGTLLRVTSSLEATEHYGFKSPSEMHSTKPTGHEGEMAAEHHEHGRSGQSDGVR